MAAPTNSFKLKEIYDYVKHVSTLSTGTIVVVGTFADKFANDSHWRWLLPMALALLLVSLLGSLIAMLFAVSIGVKSDPKSVGEWEYNGAAASLLVSLAGLFLGMLCIGVFGMRNF